MDHRKYDTTLYFLLFILFFLAVWPTLSNPSWEVGDSWRQADTFSVAYDYNKSGIDLLNPRFFYYGKEPKTVQLEWMIMPALGAILSKGVGFTPAVLRVVSASAFCGSAMFLYKLLRIRSQKEEASILGGFYYIILPYALFYGRAIMPESMALFGYLGAFYFLAKWELDKEYKTLIFSALLMGFALLEKLSLGFLGIVPVGILLFHQKQKIFVQKEAYTYGLISLAIPLLYYYIVGQNATDTFVSQIINRFVLGGMEGVKDSLSFLFATAKTAYTPLTLILGIFGLIGIYLRKDLFLGLWFLGLCLSTMVIFQGIRLGYYIIFWMPFWAYLAGEVLGSIKKSFLSYGLIFLIFFSTTFLGLDYLDREARVNPMFHSAIALMEKNIPENSYIAGNGESPVLFSATGYPGVRYPMNKSDTPEKFDALLKDGLQYYIFHKYVEMDENIMKKIRSHVDLVEQNPYIVIYKVKTEE